MHIEFAAFVAAALQSAAAEKCWNEIPGLSADPALSAFRFGCSVPVSVLPVPSGVQADICSPVLFQLANRIQGAAGAEKMPGLIPFDLNLAAPAVLAGPVLSILKRDCPWFSFHLGGTGHLNGEVTPQFVTDYFRQFLNQGSGMMFDSTGILSNQLREKSAGRNAAANFISEFSVDWPSAISGFVLSKDLLLERANGSANPDVKRITGSLPKEGRWEIDTVVMLLAVLADPEIDSTVYQRGLAGRENIPWYLTRFFRESRSYIDSLTRSCKSLNIPISSGPPFSCENEISPDLEPIWRRFFGFRETLFRSIVAPYCGAQDRRGAAGAKGRALELQPERLLYAVVELVRGYYTFYNRPEWRIEFGRLGRDQIIGALHLSVMLREVVSRAVTMLKNACDNGDFTLNK